MGPKRITNNFNLKPCRIILNRLEAESYCNDLKNKNIPKKPSQSPKPKFELSSLALKFVDENEIQKTKRNSAIKKSNTIYLKYN